MNKILNNSVKYEQQVIKDLQSQLKSLKDTENNSAKIKKLENKIFRHQQVLNYLLKK